MEIVSVRLNKEEQAVFNRYANLTGEKLSSLFKQALYQQIEDQIDYRDGINNLPESEDDIISREEMIAEFGGLSDE